MPSHAGSRTKFLSSVIRKGSHSVTVHTVQLETFLCITLFNGIQDSTTCMSKLSLIIDDTVIWWVPRLRDMHVKCTVHTFSPGICIRGVTWLGCCESWLDSTTYFSLSCSIDDILQHHCSYWSDGHPSTVADSADLAESLLRLEVLRSLQPLDDRIISLIAHSSAFTEKHQVSWLLVTRHLL